MDLGLLRDLAHRCRRYSPLVGIEDSESPDSLLLDITGGDHLFGGEARMVRQVVADFRRWGFFARAAVADTIGAAWAVTRTAGGPLIVLPSQQAQALSRLPVEALRISAEVAEVLHSLGLSTIGHLAALPRETLPSRFGPEVLRRLDQALGEIPEPIVPERPEEPIEAAYGCEPPIENRAAIEIVLQRLLERVMKKLRLRNAGILQLDVELTVSGKKPASLTPSPIPMGEGRVRAGFTVGLVRPSLDQKRLRELLRLQLERVQLKGRLAGATLRVIRTAPLDADQTALFESAERRHARRDLDSLLNRLSNRLGPRAVLCPRLAPDYQPERAVEYATLAERVSQLKSRARSKRSARGSSCRLAASAPVKNVTRLARNKKTADFVRGSLAARESLPRRPLRLFPEPVPVEVYSVVPDGPPIRLRWGDRDQQITHCEGPERIETGWWRWPAVDRDYFRADTEDGQRLWLFHARDEGSWFVHGEF
ncbi:MAG TPA: DNA polymerase Y family protein [Planctomycetaceae bacterium]|nr:DNA polymerase Y family protein [Planctomycetaceae bacterium]